MDLVHRLELKTFGLEHNKMENKTSRPVIPVASFPVRKNALVEFPVSSADQFEG